MGHRSVLLVERETGKATRTNTGQTVRQHLNTYFHAVEVPFPFLPREAL